jgi:hypothetical protein
MMTFEESKEIITKYSKEFVPELSLLDTLLKMQKNYSNLTKSQQHAYELLYNGMKKMFI